ncbi:hypothetical protein TWF281_002820 [Arthrobotrys megalospora]
MESLPVELLRRIAAYTPYPTIHSLTLTSHKLRAAVHDWQVYKSIIDNQVHLFTPDPRYPNKSTTVSNSILTHDLDIRPWSRNPITPSTAADAAAKYAHADYKAYNLPTNAPLYDSKMVPEPNDDTPTYGYDEKVLEYFAKWGGVLAAQGHPLIHLLGHTHIPSVDSEPIIWNPNSMSPTYRYALSFCIAAHLLSDTINPPPSAGIAEGTQLEQITHFSTSQSHSAFLSGSEAHINANWSNLLLHFGNLGESTYYSMPNGEFRMISHQSYRDIQYEGYDVPRTRADMDKSDNDSETTKEGVKCSALALLELCVKTVGVIGWHYRRLILGQRVPKFRELRWRWDGEPDDEQVKEVKTKYDPRQLWGPPMALGVPFENFMKLEEELGGDGAGFVWSHLEGMMNQEFLEEGKWMGFYTYGDMREIDPAMIDIVFTVVDPKELEPRQRRDEDSSDEDYDEDDEDDDDQNEGSVKGGETGEGANKEEKEPTNDEEEEDEEEDEEDEEGEEEEETPDVPIVAVKATGKDGLGDFVLWGKFFPKTGKVQLTKAYYKGEEAGTMWNWTVFMTPFGMIGRWGDRGFGGYLWLWKEDWYGDVEGNELANRLHRERPS